MKDKIVGIIQARMGSKRFPGKMAADLCGYPVIEWVIRRVKQSKLLEEIWLATSVQKENDYLEEVGKRHGIKIFRGNEENVLSRFVQISEVSSANVIVRICADNPLITPSEIDRIIKLYLKEKPDYAFNHIPKMNNGYVDGIGAEVFSKKILFQIYNSILNKQQCEHVTKFIWDNVDMFYIKTIKAPKKYSYPDISLDIDTESDLIFINTLINNVYKDIYILNVDVNLLLAKLVKK